MECSICLGLLSDDSIMCQFCKDAFCLDCFCTYLTTTPSDPMCPQRNCKKPWRLDFVESSVPEKWFKTTYSEFRTKIMMERERALLPAAQGSAKLYRDAVTMKQQVTDYKKRAIAAVEREFHSGIPVFTHNNEKGKKAMLEKAIQSQQPHVEVNLYIRLYNNESPATFLRDPSPSSGNESTSELAIIGKCPMDKCLGFINEKRMCGLCKTLVCSKCGEGKREDHECDANTVKSYKMIKNETKPCPKCMQPIFKIDGCDQMFCTVKDCHTAFSWNTGEIVMNATRIHNPHYFEWQRTLHKNGEIPRVCEDGRLMPFPTSLKKDIFFGYLDRFLAITRDERINRKPLKSNFDLRVRYLAEEINETQFASTVRAREKKQRKIVDRNNIYHAFCDGMVFMVNSYIKDVDNVAQVNMHSVVDPKKAELMETIQNFATFINDSFTTLQKRYDCNTVQLVLPKPLQMSWGWIDIKKNDKNKKKRRVEEEEEEEETINIL